MVDDGLLLVPHQTTSCLIISAWNLRSQHDCWEAMANLSIELAGIFGLGWLVLLHCKMKDDTAIW